MIDPREVQALEDAALAFEHARDVCDAAFVDLLQAARRLGLLAGGKRGDPRDPRPAREVRDAAPSPQVPSPTGDACRCGGWMVRTGRCLTCQACGQQSGGCG